MTLTVEFWLPPLQSALAATQQEKGLIEPSKRTVPVQKFVADLRFTESLVDYFFCCKFKPSKNPMGGIHLFVLYFLFVSDEPSTNALPLVHLWLALANAKWIGSKHDNERIIFVCSI